MAFLPSDVAIADATSAGVTPASNSRALPSGKVREIWAIVASSSVWRLPSARLRVYDGVYLEWPGRQVNIAFCSACVSLASGSTEDILPEFLDTASGRRIAYVKTDGTGPGVVFLGGFMSDMTGNKAIWLENWAKAQGRAYLRLDYSGHGASSGAFTDGCIGDWAADTEAAIRALTQGPQILVGSSMGGWISLVLARRMPEKLAGLVGIAAAPDFTEDAYWAKFSPAERQTIMTEGQIEVPTEYEAPYIITRRLIEDGR
ncbi:MAG: alpha/beta hydrolase, partial [Marinosulfonomonas sp.]|nr:alpha/beta hydrolase [Marinosulfonomonas sp.]